MGGKKVNYIQHNKIYHGYLHLKLCWSAKFKLLCSVASDRVIYGWDIDASQPIFQISRHSDLITDFIAVDNLELFVTSSMDHRIVLWSAQTRRVKVNNLPSVANSNDNHTPF
jgi:WD40 repeat protein